MMNTTSTLAIALLLITAPIAVYAQTTEDPAATIEQSEASPTALGSDEVLQEKQAEPVEGQIILQSKNSVLAAELVDASVYSPDDEAIGKINDLIVNMDGTVEGVVIGVGGFFGIGEKNIAVEMDALSVNPQSYGAVKLVLDATKEDLEAAPPFKTAAQQQLEEEAEKARSDLLQDSLDSGASSTSTDSTSTQ